MTVTVKAKTDEPVTPPAQEGVSVDERFDTVPEVKDAKTRPIPVFPRGAERGEPAAENGWLVFSTSPARSTAMSWICRCKTAFTPSTIRPRMKTRREFWGWGKNYLGYTFRAGAKATQSQFYVVDSDQTNLLKFQFFNSEQNP